MLRIGIIGAGIGGLTAAVALRRAGFAPDVYEQAPFLSGGVDSAALVALASRAQPRLTTLTVVFDEREFSEGAEARHIAQQFQTEHREVRVTSQDFMRELPNVLRVMDQPTNDGVNTYFVSRAARQAGLTVVLSGCGGDEVFGGYKHHHWLARHGNALRRFSALPRPVRNAVLSTAAGYGRMRGRENWMRLANLSKGVNDAGLYLALRGFFAPAQVRALLDAGDREVSQVAAEYLDPFRPPMPTASPPRPSSGTLKCSATCTINSCAIPTFSAWPMRSKCACRTSTTCLSNGFRARLPYPPPTEATSRCSPKP